MGSEGEYNRVKLDENRLILGKLYSTPLNSNGS